MSKQQYTQENLSPSQLPPLSPEIEKIRRRLIRLMIISVTIMLISIAAVLIGIFTKIKLQDTAESNISLNIPEQAKIISQQFNGDLLSLQLQLPNGHNAFLIYNYKNNKKISLIEIKN